jgi:hypothetical protein
VYGNLVTCTARNWISLFSSDMIKVTFDGENTRGFRGGPYPLHSLLCVAPYRKKKS